MIKKRISILLVEDNPLAKKMAVIFLEQLDCKVDAVSTASEAIEHFMSNEYDLVFMDIGLPDMCGLTVMSAMRKNSDIPIVALTAHSDKAYIEESYKMGATDFLVKPLNKIVGRAMLQRYVSGYLSF